MRTYLLPRPWWATLAALPLLAGCESKFDIDLVVGPAPEESNVTVRVEGVDLRRIDGDLEKVRRNATGEFESQAGSPDTARELVTDAKIDNGEYAGVRLILAEDAGDVQVEGEPDELIEPSATADTRDAEVAFDFEDNDDNDVGVVVALDLVLSLSQDNGEGEYTLDPVIRAMETEDAAGINGTIPASRFDDAACDEGTKRVYAFVGTGVEPDERDGNEAEPIAVADIVRTSAVSAGTFEFQYMPPDDYTLAFTCEGEFENGIEPADDEVIDFFEGADIRLDPGEELQVEFDD
ncbi:MAG: hypothetical protein K0Q76_2513 [Panacagrimonas sp.]|jgi:hypothetical protein|nr:hypothetical protein [Panacagrimonas sp.]MCC2657405.1 hypothetical protein [Panacagrimonas sp.]